MNGPLCFKAQALDNTSPDHYQIGAEMLLPDDETRRKRVSNMISEVAREGKTILNANGAELIIHHRRFLAQVYSVQRDEAGRRAPIICCGEFRATHLPPNAGSFVVSAIDDFAKNIGRAVEPDHTRAILAAITNTKKRRRLRAHRVGLWIVTLSLILVIVTMFR